MSLMYTHLTVLYWFVIYLLVKSFITYVEYFISRRFLSMQLHVYTKKQIFVHLDSVEIRNVAKISRGHYNEVLL